MVPGVPSYLREEVSDRCDTQRRSDGGEAS